MSQKQQVAFSTKTDRLQAVTHIVKKLLRDSGGELMLQHARTQTLEKLQDLDGDDELQSFDDDDFDDIVKNSGSFITTDGKFGQETIVDVTTTGSHPSWLSTQTTEDTSNSPIDNAIDIDGLQSNKSTDNADFGKLDCLTDHQPDALKEAGFSSFRDLYEADIDNLTDVPGVTGAVAEDIQAQASEHIDPIEEIAQEAYEAEMKEHMDVGDHTSTQEGMGEGHLIRDVKIPAGKPRGPEYEGTNEPRHIHGLPVLELPTLTPDILAELTEDMDNLTELMRVLESLITYDKQFKGFRETLTDDFDSIEELNTALEHPRELDSQHQILTQVAADPEKLREGIQQEVNTTVTEENIQQVVNSIDLAFEDEIPVKARLNILNGMKRELENDPNVSSLLEDQTLDDLVQVSESPIELDHPFIDDLDEFPVLKTRTLLTGESDVQAIAKLIAKDNYAVDLMGHAGVGKDTVLKVLGAATNRPTVTINMDESMISQDILGQHHIDETGAITFEPGVLPHSGEYGYMLIISEVNAATAGILTAFHQTLERNGKIHVKEEDRLIIPSSKFRIATTRNPPTREYNGAKDLNGAFKRRINSLWLPYLDKQDEIDLIDAMVNDDRQKIDRADIAILVDIANTFRDEADSNNMKFPRLSTSKVLQIVDLYDGSDDLLGAAKESIKASLSVQHEEEACMNAVEDHF